MYHLCSSYGDDASPRFIDLRLGVRQGVFPVGLRVRAPCAGTSSAAARAHARLAADALGSHAPAMSFN